MLIMEGLLSIAITFRIVARLERSFQLQTKTVPNGVIRDGLASEFLSEGWLPAGLEAGAAVDRPVVPRLERNTGRCAACCAHGIVHLALTAFGALAAGGLLCVTAGLAALGLVLEALLCIELLFSGGENEFHATVTAYENFVFEHFG